MSILLKPETSRRKILARVQVINIHERGKMTNLNVEIVEREFTRAAYMTRERLSSREFSDWKFYRREPEDRRFSDRKFSEECCQLGGIRTGRTSVYPKPQTGEAVTSKHYFTPIRVSNTETPYKLSKLVNKIEPVNLKEIQKKIMNKKSSNLSKGLGNMGKKIIHAKINKHTSWNTSMDLGPNNHTRINLSYKCTISDPTPRKANAPRNCQPEKKTTTKNIQDTPPTRTSNMDPREKSKEGKDESASINENSTIHNLSCLKIDKHIQEIEKNQAEQALTGENLDHKEDHSEEETHGTEENINIPVSNMHTGILRIKDRGHENINTSYNVFQKKCLDKIIMPAPGNIADNHSIIYQTASTKTNMDKNPRFNKTSLLIAGDIESNPGPDIPETPRTKFLYNL